MDTLKKIVWLGNSLENLQNFPEDVKDIVGYALPKAQKGLTPKNTKPLTGIKPTVMEIVVPYDSNAYRAVYTTKIGEVIYVLHCFQKKSKHGVKTPPKDLDLIKQRLKVAEEDHKINYQTKKRGE